MSSITKDEAKIAAKQLYHQSQHLERMAKLFPEHREVHMKKSMACRNVARVLKEQSQ